MGCGILSHPIVVCVFLLCRPFSGFYMLFRIIITMVICYVVLFIEIVSLPLKVVLFARWCCQKVVFRKIF